MPSDEESSFRIKCGNKQTFNLLTQKHTLTERQHDRQDRQENNREVGYKRKKS
jgi:hypothetical protein